MANTLIKNFNELAQSVDYSFMNKLSTEPNPRQDGVDHDPREVFSGHYVAVAPTPLKDLEYVIHSSTFFKELGLSDKLIEDSDFQKAFTGDLSTAPPPMKKYGWATGYALSIYGTEYTHQCPFRTGNGYGDGRALSIFEGVLNGKRWEMQLKGSGRTPYCRGADGRAVLRSSIREFLAQEHMHALGIPTTRSLCLYTSKTESVMRPWYSGDSKSYDPDAMMKHLVAITTRVAPSFIRVGQLELFARRVRRDNGSEQTIQELKQLVHHLIEREYSAEIDPQLPFARQITALATSFRERLADLVTHWLRVGYCQGNFNSDNCHAGGLTLDYGPFGFCELFDPAFQPWTGGGRHFSFFNQPKAAELNFIKFCEAIGELLEQGSAEKKELAQIADEFENIMHNKLERMWSEKLGWQNFEAEIFEKLIFLMIETKVDYTLFFRELSNLPQNIDGLKKSFYSQVSDDLAKRWQTWLGQWRERVTSSSGLSASDVILKMKKVNPKSSWREWLIVPAYQKAAQGDYSLIHELLSVLSSPYQEPAKEIETKYYQLRPDAYSNLGGVSHYSCSS